MASPTCFPKIGATYTFRSVDNKKFLNVGGNHDETQFLYADRDDSNSAGCVFTCILLTDEKNKDQPLVAFQVVVDGTPMYLRRKTEDQPKIDYIEATNEPINNALQFRYQLLPNVDGKQAVAFKADNDRFWTVADNRDEGAYIEAVSDDSQKDDTHFIVSEVRQFPKSGAIYAFKGGNGQYLSKLNYGKIADYIRAGNDSVEPSCKFRCTVLEDGKVAFQGAPEAGSAWYVSRNEVDREKHLDMIEVGGPLDATAQFTYEIAAGPGASYPGTTIYLKTDNGKYWVIGENAYIEARARRSEPSSLYQFTAIEVPQ